MILLTFQHVLKIGNVSVFCKDLGPIFQFFFLSIFVTKSVETLQTCTCGFRGYSRGALAMLAATSVPQVL